MDTGVLFWEQPDGTVIEFRVEKPQTTVGRQGTDISIPNVGISRLHAVIERRGA
jgi:pSer/pThr/pTyr-binding forkhead associated (FHA) protein